MPQSIHARLLLLAVLVVAVGGGAKGQDAGGSAAVTSTADEPPASTQAPRDPNAPSDDLVVELVPTPTATPEPSPEPIARPAPIAPLAAVPVVAPAPRAAPAFSCGTHAFCYPRLALAGPIVPYGDCSGTTDVGTQIRSLTCVSDHYLAAHAFTTFGRIAQWRAGDLVLAYGQRFIVFGAFTQEGCGKPARALAPLSLQTSLTQRYCGPILVVQARPG